MVKNLYQQQLGFNQGGSSSSLSSSNHTSRTRSASESTHLLDLSSGYDFSPSNHQFCQVIGSPLPLLSETFLHSETEDEATSIVAILSNSSETINTHDTATDISSYHDSPHQQPTPLLKLSYRGTHTGTKQLQKIENTQSKMLCFIMADMSDLIASMG